MKEKFILKVTSSILLFTMLSINTPIFALSKEETVYTKLDASRK